MENEYAMRINQAINYIHDNLERNLTVEEIANHCCFSKYYFNRIFKSIVDESIYSFIKRLKLEAAAFKLRANSRMAITDIALSVGYSPSNFATAFRDYFGISASDFRKNHKVPVKDSYRDIAEHIANMKKRDGYFEQVDSRITIRHFPEMYLEYERFIGKYGDLKEAWEKFCNEVSLRHTLGEANKFMGISYDDPLITDENHCIYDMCVRVDHIRHVNAHTLEAGLYACYDFYDKLEHMGKAFNEIFALWMPFTRYCIDCMPRRLPIELYQSPLDEEGKMHVEICVPITESRF